MNKKGFTVVEVIVSFALTMIVVALLFQMLLSLKDLYVSSGFKSQLLNKQALMSSKINNDLKNKTVVMALKCGDNCLNFFFNDNTNSKLIVDDKNHIFTYNDYTTKLVDGSKFGQIVVRNEKVNGLDPLTNFDSFIEIKIPIQHSLLKEDYGVSMVYQYDSRTSSIADINFTTLGDIEYKIVLRGSRYHYFPSGTTYVESGYDVLKADDGTINPAGYNVTVTGTALNTIGAISTLTYTLRNPSNAIVDTVTRTTHAIQSVYNFTYTGSSQQFTAPVNGVYRVELWGAQGGSVGNGKGAYVKGDVNIVDDGIPYYIYVGQRLTTANLTSFNGGPSSSGGQPGGGATDLRLSSGNWDDVTGLRSRIIVAGGAGADSTAVSNYHGGSLIGLPGASSTGGTQTSGGTGSGGFSSGTFGIGGNGCGGGGGYYGGGGATCATGAGGGSSFISGHPGVNAINSDGTHSNQSNHFSGLVFSNTEMKAGNEVMPNPAGGTQTGHSGNGYARITLISVINN